VNRANVLTIHWLPGRLVTSASVSVLILAALGCMADAEHVDAGSMESASATVDDPVEEWGEAEAGDPKLAEVLRLLEPLAFEPEWGARDEREYNRILIDARWSPRETYPPQLGVESVLAYLPWTLSAGARSEVEELGYRICALGTGTEACAEELPGQPMLVVGLGRPEATGESTWTIEAGWVRVERNYLTSVLGVLEVERRNGELTRVGYDLWGHEH
jgi:hypothetical protein